MRSQLQNVERVQGTRGEGCGAFAALRADGSVVAWGDPRAGGNCSQIQEKLRNVQEMQATKSAFAALLQDGSVVVWGDPAHGGRFPLGVEARLKDVKHIQASDAAFAAILADGSVVTW